MNKIDCKACTLQHNCNISQVFDSQINSGHLVVNRKSYKTNETFNLSRKGSWGKYLVVKSGAFCTCLVDSNNAIFNIMYYFYNDIVDLFGIFGNTEKIFIKALSASRVCHVRIKDDIPGDYSFLEKHSVLVNTEIRNNIERNYVMSQADTSKRISSFIACLSLRMMRSGLSGMEFALPFDLIELSNYIQTSHESVVKSLTRMINEGKFILIDGNLTILDEYWMTGIIRNAPFSVSH